MEGKVWCFPLRLNECFCEWSLVALRGRCHSLNSCYLWGKMSGFVSGVWWFLRVEERTTKTGSSLEYHVFWPEPKPPSRKLKLKVFDNWTSPRRRQVRRRCSVAAASVVHYGKWTLDSRTQLMFVDGDTQVVLFIVSFEILWRRRDVRESGQHRERRWRGCRTLSWKHFKGALQHRMKSVEYHPWISANVWCRSFCDVMRYHWPWRAWCNASYLDINELSKDKHELSVDTAASPVVSSI